MARQVKSNGTLGKVVATYPLPTIDTLLARFKWCKYFSTLNLRSGYYHIKLTKESSAKMTFVTDKGKWQFHSLPFGINSRSICVQLCFRNNHEALPGVCTKLSGWHNNLLKELEGTFRKSQRSLQSTSRSNLKIKESKCEFFKSKVHYLGYLVGADGVEPLPEKLEAIQKLRQFLGLTGFYRKFVPFYADTTQYLTKLLRKGIRYEWSEQCEHAFNILIEELCKAPTLQYLDPNKPFELFTDASHYCYSGFLHQAKIGNPEQLIPIAYF